MNTPQTLLDNARGHLAAALVQRAPSDDAIIMDHVQAAYDALRPIVSLTRKRPLTVDEAEVIEAAVEYINWCEGARYGPGEKAKADALKRLTHAVEMLASTNDGRCPSYQDEELSA